MISVIIPTFNEASIISKTIKQIKDRDTVKSVTEIIVTDGGSTDGTINEARLAGAKVISSTKGRAAQMNAGAAIANNSFLYFLHADTSLPADYTKQIIEAIHKGYTTGCFRLEFDVDHWFLKANAWFTRFDINAFRFGDQSLFVSKKVFMQAGGFDESLIMLEDQEIIPRLRQYGRFTVLNKPVTTSSRKYLLNGIYKTQAIYFLIYTLYRLGLSQKKLLKLYRRLIVQDKL